MDKTFQNLQKLPLASFALTIIPTNKINVTFQTGIFNSFKSLHSFNINSDVSKLKLQLDSIGSKLDTISLKLQLPDFKLTKHSLMPIAKWNSTLKFLQFLRSHIVTIGDCSFAKFSQLQKLTIKNAKLENLEAHAFYGLNHLQELYLSNNEMTIFPSMALSETSISESLMVLDLSYNKITSVHDQHPLPTSLSDLILDYNPVTSLKEPLCGFQNITNFCLSHLRESRCYFTLCKTVPKLLKKLDLSMPLHRYMFTDHAVPFIFSQNTPYLETLILSEVFISKSSIIRMQHLSRLKHLEAAASCENIFDLPSLWGRYIQFPKLTFLSLASNRLTSITKMELSRTAPLIQHLILKNNRIEKVGHDAFSTLTKLEYLNLAGNLFHRVDTFVHMKSLRKLDLSFNFVSEVPEKFFQAIKTTSLKTLDLSGNPYHCTCTIQPFKKWILSDNYIYLKVGVNPSLKREMWLLMHLITKKACTKMYKSIHFWNQKSQMNPMVATDFCKIMRFSRKSSVTMVTIEFFLDSITKIWFY